MLSRLRGAAVDASFLVAYQRNFRLLVFSTSSAVICWHYVERIKFLRIELGTDGKSSVGHVGGKPSWLLDDETPSMVAGQSAIFLLQLYERLQFQTEGGAPRQMTLGLDGSPELSSSPSYELFIGNAIYFFGPKVPAADQVYVLTQI
jgi:hypothetical protein